MKTIKNINDINDIRNIVKGRIYETNSALGYNELAYLFHIKEDKYIVIGFNKYLIEHYFMNIYKLGNIMNIEYEQVQKSDYDIDESLLIDSTLFLYFLKNITKIKVCSNCKKRNIGTYDICNIVEVLQRQHLKYDEDVFSCNEWEEISS